MITAVTTTRDGQAVATPFSWSYSRIKNFETCPHRYNQIDVLKNFKEADSEELKAGFAVHDALAKRINNARPLPPTMPYEVWADYVMDGVDRTKMTFGAERKLAITSQFQPCEYFDKKKLVWLRTVADVLRVDGDYAHIIDWKTGKVKPEPEQLMLIATCVMAHFPQVMRIKAELIWLAYDTKTVIECTADDVAGFWPEMMQKVNKLKLAHQTNDFPKKKSGLCRAWCVVTSCENCGQ